MHQKWYRALLRRRSFIIILIVIQAAMIAVSLIISSKDAAIMVRGRAAWSFTLMFLQMWELC